MADPKWPPGWAPRVVDEQPHATVRQIGRWTYSVQIVDGISTVGPGPGGGGWHVLGRKRAERFARRMMARYMRDQYLSSRPPTVIWPQERP